MHALEFLDKPTLDAVPMAVLFGEEDFLRREALARLVQANREDDEDDFARSDFTGDAAELADVLDAVGTRSLFGGSRRVVIVRDADSFIKKYRSELETYAGKPRSSGVLILTVKSWMKSTRLHKAVEKIGCVVECKTPSEKELTKWLTVWAKSKYGKQLKREDAQRMLELVGPAMGLLNQELAKLAALAGEEELLTSQMIDDLVGGWRTKTAWQMLDLAADGQAGPALEQLDKLLTAGENPVGILAQISSVLRRFAAATRLVYDAEAAGKRPNLRNLLTEAGVKPFTLARSEKQLRKIGRQRGALLYRWLIQCDLMLKGDSTMPPRAVLELLIARLARPLKR